MPKGETFIKTFIIYCRHSNYSLIPRLPHSGLRTLNLCGLQHSTLLYDRAVVHMLHLNILVLTVSLWGDKSLLRNVSYLIRIQVEVLGQWRPIWTAVPQNNFILLMYGSRGDVWYPFCPIWIKFGLLGLKKANIWYHVNSIFPFSSDQNLTRVAKWFDILNVH